MREALFAVRDSLKGRNFRRINAEYAQLELKYKSWREHVNENRELVRSLFGESQARFIYDQSNDVLKVDNCGVVVRWGQETPSEKCKQAFAFNSRELQTLQDAENDRLSGKGPGYTPSEAISIPKDLHTSFRIAKGLVEFRVRCLRKELGIEDPEVLECPAGKGAQYAMQQRVNLAGLRVRDLASNLSHND